MTIPRYVVALSLCALLTLISPRIQAQSFECAKVRTVVEKAICNDDYVAEMDVQLAKDYHEALMDNPTTRSHLMSEERQWLAWRERWCSQYRNDSTKMDGCLQYLYSRRIVEMEGYLATSRKACGASGFEKVQAAGPSGDVRSFVPAGEVAIEVECADLIGNGQQGFLLVTQKEGDRRLQVLLRKPDGKLSAVVQNKNVIQPQAFDGMGGGYTIIGHHGRINVTNTTAGSGGGDAYAFDFQWSPSDNTWLLIRVEKELSGYAHTTDDHGFVRLPKDFGRITINQFDFHAFAND